jgi:hypothetical protein
VSTNRINRFLMQTPLPTATDRTATSLLQEGVDLLNGMVVQVDGGLDLAGQPIDRLQPGDQGLP